ncbi:Unknown protein, partial [Striga hermonthica]
SRDSKKEKRDEWQRRPMLFERQEIPHFYALRKDMTEVLEAMEQKMSTLQNMGPLKALGMDGLNALFFQKNWETVGPSVRTIIRKMWWDGVVLSRVNQTLITLIPKVENPNTIKQFRPISLLNVIYKLFTKILVNRMKHTLSDLIHPAQASFVPGRHITDNIVVAQELIHSMRCMRGAKGYMVIKVDLEKAYDYLRWDFIEETLRLAGYPDQLIIAIMPCISSASMSLLWNGSSGEEFSPTRPW